LSSVHQIVLVHQPYVPATLAAAERVGRYLARQGKRFIVCSAHDLAHCEVGAVDLAVCFGGDGTALRTARWLAESETPVVPIRMGKLSFLGELAPTDLPDGLQPYIEGDFWRDERAMLSVRHGETRMLALNDAVLVRGESPRAVQIETSVNGAAVATFLADGVIVSTATGSTAYSLAAGGPVLAPSLAAMVLTPIAPHLTALRSLVVPPDVAVQLTTRSYAPVVLTVDGQADLSLEMDQTVEVTVAPERSVFARRGERSTFYEGLAAKLHRG
jgi:NAD+ kinase